MWEPGHGAVQAPQPTPPPPPPPPSPPPQETEPLSHLATPGVTGTPPAAPDLRATHEELSINPHQASGLVITQGQPDPAVPPPLPSLLQTIRLLTGNPAGLHTVPVSDFNGACREALAVWLQQERDLTKFLLLCVACYEYALTTLRVALRETRQETQQQQQVISGDEASENGRQPPPPPQPAEDVRAEVDTVGDQGGTQPPQPSPAEMAGRDVGSVDPGVGRGGAGAMMTLETGSIPEVNQSGSLGLGVAATLPLEDKLEVLFHELKRYQEALQEKRLERQTAELTSHALQTQLGDALREKEEVEARWRNEVAIKDDKIRDLEQQLQRARSNRDNLHLRPGVKRGRFTLSRSSRLECVKCREVFSCEQDARTSICLHHPMPACKLPNKMVAEVFPTEVCKQRYWPCCKQIDSKMPPPCQHGKHVIQAL